jgi:HD-like signal output (HDOD) protein
VDKTDLGILSSTAILGNIGQLLISSEIESLNIIDEFLESTRNFGFSVAEEQHLHTNNAFVTSDILSFWHLKNEIIDSIKYSYDLNNAPLEVRSLAVANHIVYTLVDLDGSICPEVSQEVLDLMSQEGLDPNPLIKALAKLTSSE